MSNSQQDLPKQEKTNSEEKSFSTSLGDQDNEGLQSEPSTSLQTSKKNLWERLQEKGYSESKIGQGFIMYWKMPKKETKTR